MFDKTTFNAISAGLLLIGGFAWFTWWEAKPARKTSKYNRPAQHRLIAAPKPKPPKAEPAKPTRPAKPQVNPETLKAMHKQADAERAIAEALERKMLRTTDPVKHARLEKQAANSWLKFNKILDQIDKITM